MMIADRERKLLTDKPGTKGSMKVICWDSVMEFNDKFKELEWKNPGNKARATKCIEGKEGGSGQKWYGAPTVTELYKRFREGWAEGSRRLSEIATRDIHPVSIRRRRERAEFGDEVDMQSVYRGDLPRAWTRCRRRAGSGVRSVTIVVNLGANCTVDADQMFWRGAAALRLADALVGSGYSIAIVGAEACQRYDSDSNNVLAQFVEIKAEDQPLDLDKLAALTAMPGYFRTTLFGGICYAADLNGREVDWGLGSDTCGELGNALKLTQYPQTAFVQPEINSRDSAEAWIDSVLNSIETPEQMAA